MQHDTDTPSGLIRYAIEKMEDWDSVPERTVDMNDFHSAEFGGKPCSACLGGITGIYMSGIDSEFWPDINCSMDIMKHNPATSHSELWGIECAMDYARLGEIPGVFYEMGIDLPNGDRPDAPGSGDFESYRITPYETSKTEFVRDMLRMADYLEHHGY